LVFRNMRVGKRQGVDCRGRVWHESTAVDLHGVEVQPSIRCRKKKVALEVLRRNRDY
jgi:hypothetical protein